jgi:mRNA interferase RelE/StbE
MAVYNVTLSRKAQKQLDKLDDHTAAPLLRAMGELASTPRPHGCKKLKGREAYRIRCGDYRIIYNIIDKVLTIDVIAVV